MLRSPKHTPSATALERMRLILLVPALLGTVLTAVTIVAHGEVDPSLQVAGVLAVALLAVLWARGYRHRGFAVSSELPEAVAMVIALLAAPGIPPLPLFGLTYRALYGGPLRSVLRLVAWLAIVSGTALISHRFEIEDQAGKAAGLMLAVGLMHILVSTFRHLDRAESRMRAVIEQSTDVVAIAGVDLRIHWGGTSIRPAGRVLPALVEGTSFLDLLDVDDRAMVEHLAATAAAGVSDGMPFVVRMRGDRGENCEVEVVIRNRLGDEHIQGLLLTLRDVTERRRLERERAALHEQREADAAARIALERLRERVEAQRHRQHLESRVQRSERLVSVGQLAGGVAHDFNNLLAAILNYTTMIREDLPADGDVQEDLAEIEEAARRGVRLVRQLLAFSSGELTSPVVLDPNEVIAGLRGLLEHSLGGHVQLCFELDPDCAAVTADVTNAEQILVNLVVNARDALGSTGGVVTVASANIELSPDAAVDLDMAPGSYVRLSVSDDGCGMDERTAARALEPFFTTKPTGVGTGLGLATVAGIVTAAGGWIKIDSSPGKGTSVHVHLPALPAQATVAAVSRL